MKTLITLTIATFLSVASFANTNTDGIDPTKAKFEKWTKQFVEYPSQSTTKMEEGIVLVSFEISDYGDAENIIIDSGISDELNQKAIDLIIAMPKAHLYENGFTEGTRFVMPVKFSIQ